MGRKKKGVANKKGFNLSRKREVRCEAGLECNNYYKCFDKFGNPTEKDNALDYCQLFADDEMVVDKDKTIDFREKIDSVIKECDDDSLEAKNRVTSLHVLEQVLQDLWYSNQNKPRLTGREAKALELVMQMLEILQLE